MHRVKQEAETLKEDKERLWGELVKLDRRVLDGQEGVTQEFCEVLEEVERARCVCGRAPTTPSPPHPGDDGLWDPSMHRVNSDMLADVSEDELDGAPIMSAEDFWVLARFAAREEAEVETLVGE